MGATSVRWLLESHPGRAAEGGASRDTCRRLRNSKDDGPAWHNATRAQRRPRPATHFHPSAGLSIAFRCNLCSAGLRPGLPLTMT